MYPPTISAIIKKLDTNGDGTISSAELTAGLKQARANMRAQGSAPVGGNDGDQDDSGEGSQRGETPVDIRRMHEIPRTIIVDGGDGIEVGLDG